MPTLYILGGANGAGKTTYHNYSAETGYISSTLSFINVDIIAKEEFGSYSYENSLKAIEIARMRMSNHIEKKEDFMIESNLAKSEEYVWIEAMMKKGYDVKLHFLSTGDVNVNKDRVKKRISEGGHSVPENIIEHRYQMGMTYLKSKILLFTEAHLIDNYTEKAERVAFLQKGRIIEMKANCPQWAKDILFIAQRLQEKQDRNTLKESASTYRSGKRKGRKP